MDIALALDVLLPKAEYFGSTTGNQKQDFDALTWNDQRTKPTWAALTTAYNALPDEVKNPKKPGNL